jgi:hypothetical protein
MLHPFLLSRRDCARTPLCATSEIWTIRCRVQVVSGRVQATRAEWQPRLQLTWELGGGRLVDSELRALTSANDGEFGIQSCSLSIRCRQYGYEVVLWCTEMMRGQHSGNTEMVKSGGLTRRNETKKQTRKNNWTRSKGRGYKR